MSDKFPRNYVNEAKQDDSTMVYVNDGNFGKMGIGARPSGMPKSGEGPTKSGMDIDHVGDTTGGRTK